MKIHPSRCPLKEDVLSVLNNPALVVGPRMVVAWVAIHNFLKQRGEEWSSIPELVEIGYLASDLQPKTVEVMVHNLARVGILEKRFKTRKHKTPQGVRLMVEVQIFLVATS